MRALINKLVEANTNAKLTTELVTQHFNTKGFTAFAADGKKWYPKSASSKVGKNGAPVLSLTWTTFDGKTFNDAAYVFARVYVNPETNEVIRAQIAGSDDQIEKEKSDAEYQKKLERMITHIFDNDTEIQKMRNEFSQRVGKSSWGMNVWTVSKRESSTTYEIFNAVGDMDRVDYYHDETDNRNAYLSRAVELIKNNIPGVIKVKPKTDIYSTNIRFVVQNDANANTLSIR